MGESDTYSGGHPSQPPRLFERLAQLSGYSWDQSIGPFYSSYGNWHVFGIQHGARETSATSSLRPRSNSAKSSPQLPSRPTFRYQDSGGDDTNELSLSKVESERTYVPVVARISTHVLRLEREYHLNKSFIQTSDLDCSHTVRPIDLIRLPIHADESSPMVASIFESPGRNYIRNLLDLGALPADDSSRLTGAVSEQSESDENKNTCLSTFLDFAIGASECLELLHHGLRAVHGEIRGDAFYFNHDNGAVKIINFGSGPRSFENGLTSTGWLAFSREVGIKNKLQFVAPEQTGRMPAEPDSRTDIYSLGILFWIMLTRRSPFNGGTPLDIIQSVLGRRIPLVTAYRMEIPDIISEIIRKMTQKQIDDRYHSISGLKHDLVEVQKILGNGDNEALANFVIGSKDVSSFFVLPVNIFGRTEERDKIVKVIGKVSRRQQFLETRPSGMLSHESNSISTTSENRWDGLENGTMSSDTSSQAGKEIRGSPALVPTAAPVSGTRHMNLKSQENPDLKGPLSKPTVNTGSTRDSLEIRISSETHGSGPQSSHSTGQHNGSGGFSKQRGSERIRGRNRCEVITIIGAAGLGKSSLIHSVQGEIRRSGYFSSAKFDPARKAPFEPLLRSMSSLFRQVFSESDLNSDYHNTIRANIHGVWPTLCSMLDLPINLISLEAQYTSKPTSGSQSGLSRLIRADINTSSHSKSDETSHTGAHLSTDYLRGTSNNSRSVKFMSIFLKVLRIFSDSRLICLCLDDLQYADEESLDLITNIMSRKLGIVLIITCREAQMLPDSIRTVLDSRGVSLTRIVLVPLQEQEVIKYVAATLYRPEEYCIPLAMVCLERTNGNPFYLRQMLEVCHRKGCLWYSWKLSVWEYDIDRVFSEFETENYGQQLNTSFITKRLQDLPSAARAILAWASLLGNTFSFTLVQKLLSGEFDYFEDQASPKNGCQAKVEVFKPQPIENVVEGLQATLQSYILIPGGSDDQFCFSHDRYIQASAQLRECTNIQKMHYIIVQTMMAYSSLDDRSLYARAQHVCQAANVIKRRSQHRRPFRDLLVKAAQKAIDSGARTTALQYYETCLELMQPDPWKEGAPDVYYDETLSLYTRAAEVYWFQEQHPEAEKLLASTFVGAHTAADKAYAWILQSRIHAARGDLASAFKSLKASLIELGLTFDARPTWNICDMEYKALHGQLKKSNISDLTEKPFDREATTILIGAVLTEAVSAAFWSDVLLFYQIVLKMVDYHQNRTSTFHQSGLGFSYFALIAMGRFGDLSFGSKMHHVSQQLLERSNDPYAVGRGLALSTTFVAHLLSPIRDHMDIFEDVIDQSLACGDKHVFLFSVAGLALCKLSLGVDMTEIETFCNVAPEDFGEWARDLRGGALLTAVRQVACSLQGKTRSWSADTVMSDNYHNTLDYTNFMETHASNVERPRDLYNSLLIMPLYLFGHYTEAIQVGNSLVRTIHELWSIRNSRIALFYLSLSIIAKIWDSPKDVDRDGLIEKVKSYKAQIEMWQGECEVNYLMWSLILAGGIDELTGNYHDAIQSYEAAIDHTILHDFMLDQALAIELQAGFFVRRGAKRAARSTLMDAIAIYTRIGAVGKAEQIKSNHEWVLNSTTTIRTVDAGIQTANTIGEIGNTQFRIEENERQETRNLGKETVGDRTNAWVGPDDQIDSGKQRQDLSTGLDISSLGLDVLDLQSILEFNQAISSELQVDRLLAQMTEIILESAGAQADFAGVVIEGEGGWYITASGTADNISSDAVPLSEVQDETQKQILLYTMRFREVVFIHNVVNDDRFCNAPSIKSVISLPIIQAGDLLGVLYLEGQPYAFTDRNLGVLQLLCNQVGISITNALLFRRIKKVSASNASMIDSQKRALAKARDAEIKAKLAEAEAMENVRLKEEAAKAKSMFLANVSHELRTPLNGVIGMSELLKGTNLNKEQDGYADSIRVCADTLLTVINDILDFSKLEAGKMKLFSIPMNLKETITEVVRALSYANLKRDLQTIEDLDLDPKLLVMGDPVRLHQIFMNLLSNSYKFTANGSITVRSKTEYEDDSEIRITCSIKDTGIGVTQEQVTRLFKPFSQADSSTQRSYGGSGLGLSICKALIDVLNGRIWLESQLGVGTTVSFTLTFPKVSQATTVNNAEISARDPDPMATWSSDVDGVSPRTPTLSFFNLSRIPRNQLQICIAEDNPINQKIAVSFVTKMGIKCEAFGDGLQAVEALRRKSKAHQPFHLVLMDVQMPILDGYDATRLIRKDDDPAVRGVLVIAMTASAIRGDREKCLQAGMNNYLAKPVRAAVLRSMLENYITQSSPLSPPPREIPTTTTTTSPIMDGLVKKRPSITERRSSRDAVPSKLNLSTTTTQANGNGFSSTDLPLRSFDAEEKGGEKTAIRPVYNRDKSSGNYSDETVTQDKSSGPIGNGDTVQT